MSDPQGKGYLDKSGLFMSLKLITLAQTGKDVSMPNALQDIDEIPEMSGEKPIIRPLSAPLGQVGGLDPISEEMLANYQKMFLVVAEPNPVPGQAMCVPGNKVWYHTYLNVVKMNLRSRDVFCFCASLGQRNDAGI